MESFSLLCIVLFTLIIGSATWPHNTRQGSNNSQAKGTMENTATTRHLGAVDDDDTITFPDPDDDDVVEVRNNFSAEGKGEDCIIEDICEKAKDYPFHHIEKIVKELPNLPNSTAGFVGNFVAGGSRGRPTDPDLNYLCKVAVHTAYPRTMKNLNQTTKYIVNKDEYKQGIVFETCVTTDKCDREAAFPVGVEARCHQKYSSVRLLAVDNDAEGKPVLDTFVIPSCCVCAFLKTKVN